VGIEVFERFPALTQINKLDSCQQFNCLACFPGGYYCIKVSSPSFGSNLKKGGTIDLMVSKGPAPNRVEMPNLVGMELEKAQNELKARNLSLGKIKREESQEYYKDYVISQEIDAGVRVDEATSVDLTVSQGPGPTVKTKVIKIVLPEETDYYNVQVTVDDVQGQREVYNEYHQAGDTFSVAVSYSGTGKVVVRLNGQVFDTINL
jgi:hypothetical protein